MIDLLLVIWFDLYDCCMVSISFFNTRFGVYETELKPCLAIFFWISNNDCLLLGLLSDFNYNELSISEIALTVFVTNLTVLKLVSSIGNASLDINFEGRRFEEFLNKELELLWLVEQLF